jgi:hypothetical protein
MIDRSLAPATAALVGQAHKSLELLGKATALFYNPAATTVQNTIVLVLPPAPQNAAQANSDAPFEVIDVTGEK